MELEASSKQTTNEEEDQSARTGTEWFFFGDVETLRENSIAAFSQPPPRQQPATNNQP